MKKFLSAILFGITALTLTGCCCDRDNCCYEPCCPRPDCPTPVCCPQDYQDYNYYGGDNDNCCWDKPYLRDY